VAGLGEHRWQQPSTLDPPEAVPVGGLGSRHPPWTGWREAVPWPALAASVHPGPAGGRQQCRWPALGSAGDSSLPPWTGWMGGSAGGRPWQPAPTLDRLEGGSAGGRPWQPAPTLDRLDGRQCRWSGLGEHRWQPVAGLGRGHPPWTGWMGGSAGGRPWQPAPTVDRLEGGSAGGRPWGAPAAAGAPHPGPTAGPCPWRQAKPACPSLEPTLDHPASRGG
jgi:hypothetical protein